MTTASIKFEEGQVYNSTSANHPELKMHYICTKRTAKRIAFKAVNYDDTICLGIKIYHDGAEYITIGSGMSAQTISAHALTLETSTGPELEENCEYIEGNSLFTYNG